MENQIKENCSCYTAQPMTKCSCRCHHENKSDFGIFPNNIAAVPLGLVIGYMIFIKFISPRM